MADLTRLDEALGEVLGLARAGRRAATRVARAADDGDIATTLAAVAEESGEMARRVDAVVGGRDGRKTAIRTRARATARGARERMAAYLADDEGPMRGLEFLGMAEAAETSHLEILGGLALAAGDDEVIALVEWALPLQEAHAATVRDAGIVLAALVRPDEPAPAPA